MVLVEGLAGIINLMSDKESKVERPTQQTNKRIRAQFEGYLGRIHLYLLSGGSDVTKAD
jgi:hypothetical protein